MSLMKRFYVDPYLHIRSFTLNFCAMLLACTLLHAVRTPKFYEFHFHLWHIALIPLGIYLGGLSAVYIHNATHNSFPNKWLNEICGQLAGLHQLWGFMGWKLIHLIHHHYSDTVGMDPHAPNGRGFWQFASTMFLESSAKISERYREHWGNSRKTTILHKSVLVVFLGVVALNVAFWYMLLGPAAFVFFYIPSYITNHLLFVDINYTAHPRDAVTGETVATNLDNTPYFKLANFFWHGIYYHANHHRKPLLFNPKYMAISKRSPKLSIVDNEIAA